MSRFEIVCTAEREDLFMGGTDDGVGEVIEAESADEARSIGMKRLMERLEDLEDAWSVVHCKATDTILVYDKGNNVTRRYYDFTAEMIKE